MNQSERRRYGKSNKKSAPPPNITITEASDFGDEHSLFEFDGTEEVEVRFKLKKKSNTLASTATYLKKLKAQAMSQKTSPESLLETWIAEKLA